jgi:hypothetical protein
MPIRPENKARYPKNWKSEIVPAIRARSGNRCECTGQCGQQHGPDVDGRCLRYNREPGYYDEFGMWERHRPMFDGGKKIVTIVLTVMHLDHTPENCDPANLLHACQGCHNRYDMPVRRAGIQARARAQRAAGDLFTCKETT